MPGRGPEVHSTRRMRILVTGAGGQLGRAVARRLGAFADVRACARRELDITSAADLRRVVRETRPDWIVNCAAWTDVDAAESDIEGAYRVNDLAAGLIADAALDAGARVIHFGTDYVFDGVPGGVPGDRRPYIESDAPHPLNVYGASKLAGEERLLAHPVPACVLRTSWLYAPEGRNFLLTILDLARRWSRGDPPLRVVDDQVGTPTDVASLAAQVEVAIRSGLEGLHHASCGGEASWYDFARRAIERAGLDAVAREGLVPVPTAEFPRPARRPAYSVLENARLAAAGLDTMPRWREALDRTVEKIGAA